MKLRLSKQKIGIMILGLISFISCQNIAIINTSIPFLPNFQFAIRVCFILLSIIILLTRKERILESFLLYMFMIGVFLFSGFLNSSYLIDVMRNLSNSVSICIIVLLERNKREKLDTLLYTWGVCAAILVVIDLITELKYPKGMYNTVTYEINWFLGYKTERARTSFPLVIISVYFSVKKKTRISIKTVIIFVLVLIESYFSQGTMMVVVYAIMFAIMVYVSVQKTNRKGIIKRVSEFILDYKFFLLLYTIIIVETVFVESNIVPMISNFFGKTSGISNRTVIWINLLREIRKHPLFGPGYFTAEQYRIISRFYNGSNAHNAILTILTNGGLIGLVLYVILHIRLLGKYGRKNELCANIMLMIYTNLLFGAVSSILVLAPFNMLPFMLLEIEGRYSCLEGKGLK